jgi:hypothetical protein
MSEVEALLKAYERYVHVRWDPSLAGPQKVWCAIYDSDQERRLRPRLGGFEAATLAAGHTWKLLDLTDAFAHWMASNEYAEAYFEEPTDMDPALPDFADEIARQVRTALDGPEVDGNTVLAVVGLASIFGLASASELIATVGPHVEGRLLIFFPGRLDDTKYRLLDARDGVNYLAIAITGASGGS